MSKVKREKVSKGNELLENPDAIANKITSTEDYLAKHRILVLSIGGAVALIIAGFFGYKYYTTSQNKVAQEQMFQAVFYLEADSLDKALNGDGNNMGFLEIVDDYGMTDAGNLARFYTGIIYMKKGEFQNAIDFLEDFNSSDLVIQGRAYALTGDAYMELGQYNDAVEFYNKAADYKTNEQFSPIYITKAAVAYEMLKDYQSAINKYEEIIKNYPDDYEYAPKAKKEKARLEGLTSN